MFARYDVPEENQRIFQSHAGRPGRDHAQQGVSLRCPSPYAGRYRQRTSVAISGPGVERRRGWSSMTPARAQPSCPPQPSLTRFISTPRATVPCCAARASTSDISVPRSTSPLELTTVRIGRARTMALTTCAPTPNVLCAGSTRRSRARQRENAPQRSESPEPLLAGSATAPGTPPVAASPCLFASSSVGRCPTRPMR